MKHSLHMVLPDHEEIIAAFLDGVSPLVTVALEEQSLPLARRIADSVAKGTGRLELIAIMGQGGSLRLELTARLPDGERRLITVHR